MDRLRIVTFSPGGRPIVQRDLNDGVVLSLVRDTLKLNAPQRQQQWSQAIQRYQGSTLARESHENATLEAEWYISGRRTDLANGITADNAKWNMEALMREFESITDGRYIEWRQEGSSTSTYYEIRGPAPWDFMYRWIEFQAVKTLHVKGGWTIAPLAEGDRMEIDDPFDIDSSGDYTALTGAVLGKAVGVNGLQLANTTRHSYHSARGYDYGDVQVSAGFTTGATVTAGDTLSATLALDGNNYVEARFTGSSLSIYRDNTTQLATTAVSAMTANSRYTVVLRKEGNGFYAELWSSSQPTPRPMFAPPASVSYIADPSSATAANYGFGRTLLSGHKTLAASPTGWFLTRFRVEPYVYRNRTLPDKIRMDGKIPGDAPAATTATITHQGGASAPIWGLLAWAPRVPQSPNYVQIGDFELPLDAQWSTAGITGMNAASTSYSRPVTSSAKYGSSVAQVVTPGAASQEGMNLPIYRTFRAGVNYTAQAWVRVTSATASMQLRIGEPSVGDTATSTPITADTGSMKLMQVTWTPTADRTVAYISPQTATTLATTFQFDGVTVYETALGAPVGYANTEGRGGVEPFGILQAENYLAQSGFTATPVNNSNYSNGRGLEVVSMAAISNASWDHYIDPSLLQGDDMYRGDVELEVWGRFNIPSTASSLILVARQGTVLGQTGNVRYTREYGFAGKTLTSQIPTAGGFRFIRLGTLTVNTLSSLAAVIELTMSWSSASSSGVLGFDHLMLVPVRSRACSATAKATNTGGAGYGQFITDVTEISKIIYPNLRAASSMPQYGTPPLPDVGIGGAPLWLRPGNNDLVVKLSSLVPDDPNASSTSEQTTHSATVKLSPVPRYFVTSRTVY